MRYLKEKTVAPLGAILCVCACLVGCGQKEDAPSAPAPEPKEQPVATSAVSRAEVRSTTASIDERARDAAYQERLAGFEKKKKLIRDKRREIDAKMDRLREYAKKEKKLPPGATDKQVEAALNGAPLREWYDLVAARVVNLKEEEKIHAAAQAAVAQRISRKESDGGAQGAAPAEK